MKVMIGLGILLLGCVGAEPAAGQDGKPLRVFIRAGKKTHGPGEHDHPRFLEEWVPLLKQRGAAADGSMEFPTAAQLENTDVLVLFCAEGGTVLPEERARLEAFLQRGGGITVIHDAVCGADPQWFKTVVGGAWEHGKSKFLHGNVGIYVQDYAHPITKGMSNFFINDEIYWDLHLQPEAKVIATAFRTAHEVTPQAWVYEKDAYRAYVNILGHRFDTFAAPHVRSMLLRGIAWTGKRDVDTLCSKEELAALAYPPGGPTVPAKAREQIAVPADFDLQLVLAEPDIVKPIHVGWDPQGRLWVLQTPQYPNKSTTWQKRPYDSLVYFENGKRRLFYDQLDLPTAFAFHKDGVIVMAAPEILFLRDTDGDGTADKREVLYSGFGFGDTHAVASNLRWGLDGWIYATQGYSGGGSRNIVNAAGQSFGHIGNGLFRFRPDGSAIEVVSSYGSNTWGVDLSWDQELFFTMANGSHLRHVVMSENALSRGRAGKVESWRDITDHRDAHPPLKHSVHPYLQIDNVGGFTAAAGSTVYDGGAWPDEWRKMHLVTECTINLVHRDRLEPAGVSYQAFQVDKEGEFVGGSDLWFRPIDTQIGPDGAVYIVDFYNQAVVHNDTRGPKHGPFNAAVRPDRDHLHGRLWRLQHKQAKTLASSDFASTAGLVKALEHPNRWNRQTAQRLLVERGEGAAELAALLKSTAMPEAKVAALWALQRLGKLGDPELAGALGDASAGVRKNAARAAGAAGLGRQALLAAVNDADARVRLEALVALGAVPGEGIDVLLAVGPKLDDPWSRSALVGALASAPVDALAAAAKAGDKATVEALATSVGSRQDAALAAKLVLGVVDVPDSMKAVALAALAKSLKADLAPATTPELLKALEALLASPDGAVVSGALTFAGRWVKDDALAKALEPTTKTLFGVLEGAAQPDEARLQAFTALLSLPSARAKAVAASALLLAPTASIELQRGAIEALGAAADPAVPPAYFGAWPKLAAASREAVLGQLLKRPEWTSFLLGELEAKRLKPNDLGPSALFRLRTHPDKTVASKAVAVLDAVMGAQNKAKDTIVAQLWPAVEKPGDAAKGKALFTENCLKCHQYKGEGRSIAPDLTGMGVHGKHELLVHVIDPNRTVEANYISFNVRTKGGDVFNGIVARETKDVVVLKNNEGDKEIRRADIDAMQSTGLSLMPEGLEALGADALRDILGFLTADAGNFRFIDLQTAFTMSNVKGLFDPRREPDNLPLAKFGVVLVDGVPFNVIDPAKSVNGNNAVVLKGGMAADWHSKTSLPAKVEVPMGYAASRIHLLGAVAGWGARAPRPNGPVCCKVILHYADGRTQEIGLRDGVDFAEYNIVVDVPGSKIVPGLAKRGQVRWLSLTPSRKDPIHHLTLESPDKDWAPVIFALTAEIGEPKKEQGQAPPAPAPFTKPALIVGGGSSHDFNKYWRGTDAATLGADYTDDPARIAGALPALKLLVLANNQEIPDPAARKGIFDHVDAGKGLLISHAGAWYNWKSWPEYNRELVAGGSRGHEKFQVFEVRVVEAGHPVMAGVPASFQVKDELYGYVKDPAGPEIQVLAKGVSLESGKEWPVVFVVKHEKRRIVVNTLGHAGEAHEHPAYQAILKNAAEWLTR